MKFIAERTQGILGIELLREIFVRRKSYRHWALSFATDEHRSNTDKNNFSINLRKSVSIRGFLRGLLHQLDCGSVRVANVDDALASVRTARQHLRLARGFPTGRGNLF